MEQLILCDSETTMKAIDVARVGTDEGSLFLYLDRPLSKLEIAYLLTTGGVDGDWEEAEEALAN